MPTYEYRCAKCGEHLDAVQSFSDAPLTKHAGCGGRLSRVFSGASFILKGPGFYKTDNRPARSTKSQKKPDTRSDTGPDTSSTTDASPAPESAS